MSETRTADSAAEAAFAQVLRAERAARAAVEAAGVQAEQWAELARAEARARAERTRRHIAAVRGAFARAQSAELAQLAHEAEALAADAPLDAQDRLRVESAVAALAARLTGGAP